MGQIRCLHALGEWDTLQKLSRDVWDQMEDSNKNTLASYAAAAAWNMSNWDSMNKFVEVMNENTVDGGFYRAILAINNDQVSVIFENILLN